MHPDPQRVWQAASTGAISGTPTGPVGTTTFTLQVCDSGSPQQCASSIVTIRIDSSFNLTTNSLPGGAVAAYQFTIPPNTQSVEVRLADRTGNPVLGLRGGTAMPRPPPEGWPDYAPYGSDGGYETGRQTDYNILTLSNPSNPSCTTGSRS